MTDFLTLFLQEGFETLTNTFYQNCRDKNCDLLLMYETKYSRMHQVKFVEDSLQKSA